MRRDFFFKHLKIIFLSQLDVYMQGARVRVGGASWGNPPLQLAMEERVVDLQPLLHQFLAMVPVRHIQWPEVSTMIDKCIGIVWTSDSSGLGPNQLPWSSVGILLHGCIKLP